MAARIAEAVVRDNPPRRLVLGSGAFAAIHSSLTDRISDIAAQAETAAHTDARNT